MQETAPELCDKKGKCINEVEGFGRCYEAQNIFFFQMLVVIFTLTLTLGYASARDGESCVSTNCLFVDNCFKSVKVSTHIVIF